VCRRDKRNRGPLEQEVRVQTPVLPPAPQSGNHWIAQDRECRRQAQDTLSNPYGVYAQCMQQQEAP